MVNSVQKFGGIPLPNVSTPPVYSVAMAPDRFVRATASSTGGGGPLMVYFGARAAYDGIRNWWHNITTPHVAPLPPPDGVPADGDGYWDNRDLERYNTACTNPFSGSLIENIGRRIAARRSSGPVRILDAGAGQGLAALALKRHFGRRVVVETNDDRYPKRPGVDRHHHGLFLEVPMHGPYDLLLSYYGPHATARNQLIATLEKTASLLAPDGEALIQFKVCNMATEQDQVRRHFADYLPTIMQALGRGWVIRYYYGCGGAGMYIRRIGDAPAPNLAELAPPYVYQPGPWECRPNGQFTAKGREQYLEWAADREQERARATTEIAQQLAVAPYPVEGLEIVCSAERYATLASAMYAVGIRNYWNDPRQLVQTLFNVSFQDFVTTQYRHPTAAELIDHFYDGWYVGSTHDMREYMMEAAVQAWLFEHHVRMAPVCP